MIKLIASLGIFGAIFSILMAVAVVYTWFNGVVFGFHHGFLIGVVSLLPPVGFIEGLLHLLNVI